MGAYEKTSNGRKSCKVKGLLKGSRPLCAQPSSVMDSSQVETAVCRKCQIFMFPGEAVKPPEHGEDVKVEDT